MFKHRCYLFLGNETGKKNDSLLALKAFLKQEFGEGLDYHKIYAFDSDLSQVLSLVQNGSLFSSHTMVVVGNAEEYTKKDEIQALIHYIQRPNSGATLVLLSDQHKLDSKLQGAFPKEGVKVFWEMFENEKKGWVIKTFRDLGHSISPEGAEYLLEMVENTTDQLKNEAQRISLFLGDGANITLEELETFLDHSREESVFSLFEKMVGDNLEGALEVLRKILLSSSPSQGIGLLGGIQYQVRRILEFKIRLHRHPDIHAVFKEMRVFGKKNQNTLKQADKVWTESKCQDLLCLVEEYEHRLRSFKTDLHKTLMELFLIQSLTGGGKIAPKPVFYFPSPRG